MTRPDECEVDQDTAYEVNVKGTRVLMQETSAKLIYFSTDSVFDGESGDYTENDLPNPVNYYGRTKLEAEQVVLNASSGNVVLRVAGLYGFNPANNEFLSMFKEKRLYCPIDRITSQTLLDDVVGALPQFIDCGGLFHLAHPEGISRYKFMRLAVDILHQDVEIVGRKAIELYPIARRPLRANLRTIRHNIGMTDVVSGLIKVGKQIDNPFSISDNILPTSSA